MPVTHKKKILFLITKSNWGGAQRYVFDLATHLNKDMFDVAVALGGNGELKEKLVQSGVRVLTLPSLDRDISLTKELRVARELWKLLGNEQPDILHINSSKAGGLGTLLGRMRRVPRIVFTAHGWAFNEARPFWQRSIIRVLHYLTVLLSHTTIAVSDTIRSQMNLPFIRSRFVVIHNGRAPILFLPRDDARTRIMSQVPQAHAYLNDPWSVTIAELHTVKGHTVTISAMKDVVKQHPRMRHFIIGDGEERSRLETQVRESGLTENVLFVGSLFEAAEYLKAFDLFILSSRSEALAYVVIEAMMAGLPVIATRVGGIPEIISNGVNGILVPYGDISVLSHTIQEHMKGDSGVSLGAQARERAQAFGLDRCVEETEALYNRATR